MDIKNYIEKITGSFIIEATEILIPYFNNGVIKRNRGLEIHELSNRKGETIGYMAFEYGEFKGLFRKID